ncbi:hypothetical protein VDGE_02060 [Verticillium dahliae]|uniref:MARVEL domain-containing protein n=1 Tax=Verticillium dahliae TaxID=27337 RepID=A0A444RXP9_VERDA|nr:hypothetical protein VDGE_02060 [Verticillium dahliae]
MDAQEPKPAEDATTPSGSPVDAEPKNSTPPTTFLQRTKHHVHRFLTKNIWAKDGRNRSHVPHMSVWIAGVRVLQLLLAIATLALTAYGVATIQKAVGYRRITVRQISIRDPTGKSSQESWLTLWKNWSGSEGYPFAWFAFSWTLVYLAWLGTAVLVLPIMYNCWVHLGLEILSLVFWLIVTSLLASHSDDLDSIDAYVTGLGPEYKKHYNEFIQEYARGFVVATFAATGVATCNFLLFVVTVARFGRALHDMRQKSSASTKSQTTTQASEADKTVTSPHMTHAMAAYPPWAHYPPHPHYPYYGPPFPPQSTSSNSPDGQSVPPGPHPYMPAYFPMPMHPYPQGYPTPTQQGPHQDSPDPQDPNRQATASPGSASTHTPWPPHSPHYGPPGSIWPQHSYSMYQQQVPIAAQHTGQSQPGFGSPQFPMVAPMATTKTDLQGVPPVPSAPGSVPAHTRPGLPAELNDGQLGDENMPAELSSNDHPPPPQVPPPPPTEPLETMQTAQEELPRNEAPAEQPLAAETPKEEEVPR